MKYIIFFSISLLFFNCATKEKPLPIFGERNIEGKDTIYHKIAHFEFVDQDSAIITNDTFNGKIYIADFFFTSCRTICPIMKTQLLRVYDTLRNTQDVLILSHTIDPEYDTVALLHDFAERLGRGVSLKRVHFLGSRREPGEIQGRAPKECRFVGGRHGPKPLALKSRQDKTIDVVPGPADILHRRNGGLAKRKESPISPLLGRDHHT